MTDPIYPDKEKTGLAALKPLLMAYCDEPERWVWEHNELGGKWVQSDAGTVISKVADSHWLPRYIRLTPKPRRVWIGDESYPEPIRNLSGHIKKVYVVHLEHNKISPYSWRSWTASSAAENGFAFADEESAQQCLDAYRKARRVE